MSIEHKTPNRTVAFYTRLATWSALLFISIGLSMQSLQINLSTQSTLDQEYAQAMAQQMAQGLSLKLTETQIQQNNAASHASTIAALVEPDKAWEKTLNSLISGAEKVFILNRLSSMGLQTQLGYAVQEMASRALAGVEYPLEAVKRDGQLHFYLATPIRDESNDIQGVLLIEYGSTWLEQLSMGAASKHGLITTTQVLKGTIGGGLTVFQVGEEGSSSLTPVNEAINEHWQLSFTPADERPHLAYISLIAPWFVALIGSFLTLLLLAGLQKKDIANNQLLLLNYVRGLYRQGRAPWPDFSLKIFHDVAKAMEHLAQSKGIHNNPGDTPSDREKQQVELTSPSIRSTHTRRDSVTKDQHSTQAEHAIPTLSLEEISPDR